MKIAMEMKFFLIAFLGCLASFSAGATDDVTEPVKDLDVPEGSIVPESEPAAEEEQPVPSEHLAQEMQTVTPGTTLHAFKQMDLKQNALSALVGAILAALITFALARGKLTSMKDKMEAAQEEKERAAAELAKSEAENEKKKQLLSGLKQLQTQKAEAQKKEAELNQLLDEALEE